MGRSPLSKANTGSDAASFFLKNIRDYR